MMNKYYHFSARALSFKMVETTLAPWFGGFEYMPRTINVSWDLTCGTTELIFVITLKFPTRSSKKKKNLI